MATFFYVLIALVCAVLNIILFFKIWGMTNDVGRIVDILSRKEANEAKPQRAATSENTSSPAAAEPSTSSFKGTVKRKSDGMPMGVEFVGRDGRYYCNDNIKSRYYKEDELIIEGNIEGD